MSLLPAFTLLLLFGAVFALLALRAALSDAAGCLGLAIFMALEPAGPLAGRLDSLTLVLRFFITRMTVSRRLSVV